MWSQDRAWHPSLHQTRNTRLGTAWPTGSCRVFCIKGHFTGQGSKTWGLRMWAGRKGVPSVPKGVGVVVQGAPSTARESGAVRPGPFCPREVSLAETVD